MKPSRPSLLLFRALYDERLVVQPSSKSASLEVPLSDITTRECVTKEQTKEGIANEIDKRFSRADSREVC